MDLFDYAQDLFKQQGQLNVPGLGYFSTVRKSSYYENGVMHPPCFETRFDQPKPESDDSSLTEYFAKVKNLSKGSAKYFVDKFVDNVKDRLRDGDVVFADLGKLTVDADAVIKFMPNPDIATSNFSFYGLAPVNISKVSINAPAPVFDLPDLDLQAPEQNVNAPEKVDDREENDLANQQQLSTTDAPAVEDFTAENPATDESPTTANIRNNEVSQQPRAAANKPKEYNPFFDDDEKGLVLKGKTRTPERDNSQFQFWLITGIVAIAILFGIYLLTITYFIKPADDPNNSGDISQQILNTKHNADTSMLDTLTVKASEMTRKPLVPATKVDTVADTIGPIPATGMSAIKQAVKGPVNDVIPKGAWVVSGGQNNNYFGAAHTVALYRGMGYAKARMIDSVKKADYFIYKVILGYYATKDQAVAARRALVKENKIKPKYLTVQQYK